MTAVTPWSIKGIGPEARALAKEAAHRSGMTLGAWLSHKIAAEATTWEGGPRDLGLDDDEQDEHEDRHDETPAARRSGAADAGLARVTAELANELRELRSETARLAERNDATDETVRSLVLQMNGRVGGAVERIERLSAAMTTLAGAVEKTTERAGRTDTAIRRMADAVATLNAGVQDARKAAQEAATAAADAATPRLAPDGPTLEAEIERVLRRLVASGVVASGVVAPPQPAPLAVTDESGTDEPDTQNDRYAGAPSVRRALERLDADAPSDAAPATVRIEASAEPETAFTPVAAFAPETIFAPEPAPRAPFFAAWNDAALSDDAPYGIDAAGRAGYGQDDRSEAAEPLALDLDAARRRLRADAEPADLAATDETAVAIETVVDAGADATDREPAEADANSAALIVLLRRREEEWLVLRDADAAQPATARKPRADADDALVRDREPGFSDDDELDAAPRHAAARRLDRLTDAASAFAPTPDAAAPALLLQRAVDVDAAVAQEAALADDWAQPEAIDDPWRDADGRDAADLGARDRDDDENTDQDADQDADHAIDDEIERLDTLLEEAEPAAPAPRTPDAPAASANDDWSDGVWRNDAWSEDAAEPTAAAPAVVAAGAVASWADDSDAAPATTGRAASFVERLRAGSARDDRDVEPVRTGFGRRRARPEANAAALVADEIEDFGAEDDLRSARVGVVVSLTLMALTAGCAVAYIYWIGA